MANRQAGQFGKLEIRQIGSSADWWHQILSLMSVSSAPNFTLTQTKRKGAP